MKRMIDRESILACCLAISVGFLVGCRSPEEAEAAPVTLADPSVSIFSKPQTSGLVEIEYRGQKRTAAWENGVLLIEGDILVGPADLTSPGHVGAARPGVTRNGLHIVGGGYNWGAASGLGFAAVPAVVPYEIAPAFSATQSAAIVQAMTDWSTAAPGVSFRPAVSSDSSRIRFELSTTACNSYAGRQGGTQTINLAAGCLTDFRTHHEIGHALGLQHEQSRPDRASFVSIAYGNIRGCRDAATGPAQCGWLECIGFEAECGCVGAFVGPSCYMSSNFDLATNSEPINDYDYNSIMHYGATFFTKNGLNTINVLTSGATIGNRTSFSSGDVAKMNVMYPRALAHDVYFAKTGPQRLCALVGRENDVAIDVDAYDGSTQLSSVDTQGFVDTEQLQPSTEIAVSCLISTNFWGSNYVYPNDTVSFDVSKYYDVFSNVRTVNILDPGLMVTMFDM